MNKKLLILLQEKALKPQLLELLYTSGYLTKPQSEAFTEKALKIINKQITLSEDLYKQLSKQFKENNGVVNTLETVNIHFNRMIKLNQGIVPLDYDILAAAKCWTTRSNYPGELKYFFHKDHSSRCIDEMNNLSLNKSKKIIAERA